MQAMKAIVQSDQGLDCLLTVSMATSDYIKYGNMS